MQTHLALACVVQVGDSSLDDSSEAPFYDAVTSAAAAAAAGPAGDCYGVVAEVAEEAEGTPLKKVPSAGSAVFTLVARAGAVAGPPSRQTSGQFAAEHGMPTPPGSAR